MSIPIKSAIDMGGLGIVNVVNPSSPQDVATKNYVDAAAGASTLAALTDVLLSTPGSGQVLEYNGTKWVNHSPAYSDLTGTPQLPITLANAVHKWLNSYNSATGLFTQTQPDYTDLTGTPQLPVTKIAVSSNWIRSYDSTTGLFTASQPAYSDLTGTPVLAQTLINASHKWLNSYDAFTGLFTQTQPDYSDLTGTPTLAQTLSNASHKWLNSYSSVTGLFTQTQPDYSDLTGTPTLAQTKAAVASNWLRSYDAATGLFTASQPAASDLSNGVTGSGAVVLATAPTVAALSSEKILYADQFSGADIGAKVNAAFAATVSGGSGIIEIPAGTYTFSTPIVLNPTNGTIWLRGHGSATILHFTGGAGTAAITIGNVSSSQLNASQISDMFLEGGGFGGIGIKVLKSTSFGLKILRNQISGFATQIQWGALGTSCFDGEISQNLMFPITGSQIGIDVVFGAHSVNIDSNWISSPFTTPTDTSVGIFVRGGSTSIRIVNNNIQGCPGGNILLSTANGGVNATYIGHNYFEPLGTGGIDIDVGNGVNGTVIDSNYSNAASTPSNYSIRLEAGSLNTVITNNTILNTATAAINNLLSAFGATLANNNWSGTPTFIDSGTGIGFNIGTDVNSGFAFQVKQSVAGNVVGFIRNTSATGFGLAIRNGTNSNYSLSIQDASTSANNIQLFGDGAASFAAGSVLIDGSGNVTSPNLAIGLQRLQSDTGRYGTGAIRVQATGTNAPGALTLMPSGSGTESDIRLYNTSDPANVGAVEISLAGTTMTFLTENFGTGTKPTTIDFSQFATAKAAAVITSSTTQLKLQETGDALGSINMYLRNRSGQNGAIFENPSVCLADFGMQTSAIITNIAINGSNVLTVTAAFAPVASSLPAVGQKVTLSGLTTATFLEGQVVTIVTISTTQFTAAFTHALYASAADTGIAVAQNNVRAEFRNDKVLSTLNTSGEIQFFDPTNPGSGTWLASGITGTVIGDSLSATMVARFQRALMLIGTNAVMNVTRISASMAAASPAVELAHATSNSATPDYFWDMFGSNTAGVEALSVRRRTPEFSLVGSDAVIAQFDQNGGLTLPVALISLLGTGGLPVQTNQPLVIAGGFSSPVAAKIYVGDGTGWELDFAKRVASADTTLFKMKDSGVLDIATGITIAGAATTGNVLRGNGTNFVSATLAAADLSNGVTGSGEVVLAAAPTISSLAMTGKVTTYNNISTVNNGVASQIAVVTIAARGSAVGSTILVASGTIAADGYYRVSWVSKLTRAASGGTPSSTMGPLTLTYTDAGDGTAATLVCAGTNDSGALGTTVTGNGVANHLNGIPALIFAKAGTAINYTIGYASAGTTSMLYDFEIVVEAL